MTLRRAAHLERRGQDQATNFRASPVSCYSAAPSLPRTGREPGGTEAIRGRARVRRADPVRLTATSVWPASGLQPVPGPARNAQAVRNLVGRLVIARHRRGGGPGEVIVQDLSQRPGLRDARVLHRLIEAGDAALVHLLVRAVAAMDPHDERLVSVAGGIGSGAAERLGPVGGEALTV